MTPSLVPKNSEPDKRKWANLYGVLWLIIVIVNSIVGGIFAAFIYAIVTAPFGTSAQLSQKGVIVGTIVAVSIALMYVVLFNYVIPGTRRTSSVGAARERLRKAEAKLAGELAGNVVHVVHGDLYQVSRGVTGDGTKETSTESDKSSTQLAPSAIEEIEDRLALSALWEVTHSRLDLYHQIATGQARRSFFTAQAATGVGFILLVVFAVLAAQTNTTAGAITTGALGAVSAALAGYIGRTFVRSQESAANHLRAYFDQPLEFSRYLAAERLISGGPELNNDQRATILATVVKRMLDPTAPGQKPKKRSAGR